VDKIISIQFSTKTGFFLVISIQVLDVRAIKSSTNIICLVLLT